MVRCELCKAKRSPGRTFHRFPSCKRTSAEWCKVVNRPGWVPPKNTFLCSDHFEPSCIMKFQNKTLLVEGSVPTRLNNNSIHAEREKEASSPLIFENVEIDSNCMEVEVDILSQKKFEVEIGNVLCTTCGQFGYCKCKETLNLTLCPACGTFASCECLKPKETSSRPTRVSSSVSQDQSILCVTCGVLGSCPCETPYSPPTKLSVSEQRGDLCVTCGVFGFCECPKPPEEVSSPSRLPHSDDVSQKMKERNTEQYSTILQRRSADHDHRYVLSPESCLERLISTQAQLRESKRNGIVLTKRIKRLKLKVKSLMELINAHGLSGPGHRNVASRTAAET